MTRPEPAPIIDFDAHRSAALPQRAAPRAPQPGDIAIERENFLNARRAERRKPATLDAYRDAIDLLDAFLKSQGRSRNVADVTRRDMENFFRDLQGRISDTTKRPLSPSSVAIHYRGLRAFFRWLQGWDTQGRQTDDPVIATNPMAAISQPHVPHAPVPVINDEQLEQLLAEVARDKTFDGRRDLAILGLFIDDGIRLGEMASIRVDGLDLRAETVTVSGKTGTRRVSLNATTRGNIDRYLRFRAAHPYADLPALWLGRRGSLLATGIAQMVKRRSRDLGQIHPHQFRHTFAHKWLANGGNEGDLQRAAGWNSPAMLQRYGESRAEERALVAAKSLSLLDQLASRPRNR